MSHSRIYTTWRDMKKRCVSEKCNNYKHYGALGVTYCEEWEHFPAFYEWAMKNGYSDDLTLDRIDVTGNYEPSNCRWTNKSVQNANRRRMGQTEYIGVYQNSNKMGYTTSLKSGGKRILLYWSRSKNDCARKRNEFIIQHGLLHPLNEIKEEYEDVFIPQKDRREYFAQDKKTGNIIHFNKRDDLALAVGLSSYFIGQCIKGTRNSKNYYFWKVQR